MRSKRWMWLVFASFCTLLAPQANAGGDDEEHEMDMAQPFMAPRPAMKLRAPRMGATPGGAQDIDYARDRIQAGEVPHPNTFTPEGLFSQHDLPLPATRPCKQILCLESAATRTDLLAQPEVRFVAQLGFSSNLDPKTWKRQPLNLVAVVDKSGSMSGQPLDTVKASLRHIAHQMTPRDQLAIVLYGDRSHVHLPTTSLRHKAQVLASIEQIQSAGSTYMEEGLKVGFSQAFATQKRFQGTTRVMLFTDERPNVGATDKDSFMGLAREGSRRGVGMTTIGVSTHFGAELATAVSSVRGGNLFFFPDAAEMSKRFSRDFDTMVTELAYDMNLIVRPRPGYRLVGLYGIPGDMVKRRKDGGIQMTIETVFLSRDKGGIFFAFAPAEGGALPAKPGPMADAWVNYLDNGKRRERDRLSFRVGKGPMPVGLARGVLLVEQITAMKKAAMLHRQQNKTEQAYRLVRDLHKLIRDSGVSGLSREEAMVAKLHETLTRLSGHQGETRTKLGRNTVSGLPE